MSSGSSTAAIATTLLAAVGMLVTAVAARPAVPAVVHLAAPPMTVRTVAADPSALRVCADPNNLPFSNDRLEGFENAIADLVAQDLGKRVSYYWLPQRRGFVRNSLRVGVCDVILGVPAHYGLVRTTRPYYRSAYVFVSRRGRDLPVSLDDPALRRASIGVQLTGDDYQNPPAVAALAARHLNANVRGYTVYGDYSKPNPQQAVIDDVRTGRLDTAIVWGPIAGYFARNDQASLRLAPVRPQRDPVAGPFVFAIAMGVRSEDELLQHALDDVISRRERDIDRVLRAFGVPLVQGGGS